MTADPIKVRLDSAERLALHLDALMALDQRLHPVRERAGQVEIRATGPGFAGMARIICSQQLSVASARAIWGRFAALDGALEAESFLLIEETVLRGVGLSAGKVRSMRAVAEAIAAGVLDFEQIETLPVEEAIVRLTELKGIGPWTAEIYLLFCAAHPDIFPAGDLALRKAVGHALGLENVPSIPEVSAIAEAWSPHRGAAALLFWRYFVTMKQKEGIGL
jgi:DNA-3-methyladenine glycosylase II